MRTHFIRLFDFDHYANQAIFKAIQDAGVAAAAREAGGVSAPGDAGGVSAPADAGSAAAPADGHRPLVLMAHLLAASQAWLLRSEGESSEGLVLWPRVVGGSGRGPDAEMLSDQVRISSLPESIDNNHRAWVGFLKGETDFGRMVTYRNQSGKKYTAILSDLLAHVINHGTHHRAQIGQLLKAGGMEKLPPTDYIAYLRSKD